MNSLDQLFLQEAVEIGSKILNGAHKSNCGIYWLSHKSDEEKIKSLNIYSGNGGIILFLIQLYKITKKADYYSAVIKATEEIINLSDITDNKSFYTGLGGDIFLFVEVYKLTGEKKYIDIATQIALRNQYVNSKSSSPFYEVIKVDILAGISGYILSLLHLYNETGRIEILNDIENWIELLLNNAILTNRGICWDRNGDSIKPLCGFAHGASGIAFVFVELFKFFNNDAFLTIAKQSFFYEDSYYNNDVHNWPDFRMDIYSEEGIQKIIQAYESDDLNYFIKPEYMSAWCHGAPGIAMARLHAYSITGDRTFLKHIPIVIKNILNDFSQEIYVATNYTLCHGNLGNASLLLDAYCEFNDNKLLELSKKIAIKAIQEKNRIGYYKSGYPKVSEPADYSFFMGISGIGHYYLRLLDPKIASILIPGVGEIQFKNLSSRFNQYSVLNILFRNCFDNTAMALNSSLYVPILSSEKLKSVIIKTINTHQELIDSEIVKKSLEIDIAKNEIFESVLSDVYLKFSQSIKIKDNNIYLSKCPDEELIETTICTNELLKSMKISLNTITKYYILIPHYGTKVARQYEINCSLFILIKFFSKPKKICNFITLHEKQYHTKVSCLNEIKLSLQNGLTYITQRKIDGHEK